MRTVSIIVRKFSCIAATLCLTCIAFCQVQEDWVARYNGSGFGLDSASAIAVDSLGNVYVTGVSFGAGTSYDFATLKYDSDGNVLWERRYNGPANGVDDARALAVDSAGNVYVTGKSDGVGTSQDYATLKYDTDGILLWETRYNGPANGSDIPVSIAVDSGGNVYVTGSSWSPGGSDYATLKYDANGNLLWESRFNGPADDLDSPSMLVLDNGGNVYVTGQSAGVGTSSDYATLKYDADGNLLWETRYNGPASSFDSPAAIAVDISGNVYVTGYTFFSFTSFQYVTLKYDPDGSQLWETRYNGPADGVDAPTAIALDGGGNVYVTGVSEGVGGTDQDYATLKYDTDGNLLWERRYNGPANSADIATELAIDGAGNVYVAGDSVGIGSGRDYATVKYDANGNQLWEMRYNGPVDGSDIPFAFAVDGGGNVYVTGQSPGSGTDRDFATIKYSQMVEVLPDSFSLFRGFLIGGGLSDLLASDDSWLTVRPGITLNQSERQVQLIVVGTAPTETPTELRIRVEAHASINNIGQWIELWNYDTSSWEEVDFMIATTVDSIVEVSITVDPERFVQAGTKEMKAKVSYKEAGIVLTFPWLISFDQSVWVIVP